jgi:large subunit ribosomal protein L32
MALQKRRLGKARIHHRRSAWAASFKKPLVTRCPNCGEPKAPHRVCLACGFYRNEQVIETDQATEE